MAKRLSYLRQATNCRPLSAPQSATSPGPQAGKAKEESEGERLAQNWQWGWDSLLQ